MKLLTEGLSALSRGKQLVLAFAAGLYVGVVAVLWSLTLNAGSFDPSAYTPATAAIASIVVIVAWLGLVVFFIWTGTDSETAIDT